MCFTNSTGLLDHLKFWFSCLCRLCFGNQEEFYAYFDMFHVYRYCDFVVNEVDLDGNVVHLTSLDAPTEVF